MSDEDLSAAVREAAKAVDADTPLWGKLQDAADRLSALTKPQEVQHGAEGVTRLVAHLRMNAASAAKDAHREADGSWAKAVAFGEETGYRHAATILEDALSAAPLVEGWMPIETAPKDTAVLVYGFGYDVGHFNTLLNAWVSCWDHRPINRVTHWMPLPPPPEKGKT